VFGKGHAAVVGNPPFITEKDSAKRETIRKMFPSAHRTFSLGVPFTEAFFDYARPGGFVGMITANSFMKREFGKKLIEDVLPRLNLTVVINTQGAYIPGHGTPTVILFGTAEPPVERDVLTVLASRGEPSTPADPEQGEVWRSIAEHGEEIGFENDYITVRTTPRAGLRAHPWSLGGGGAAELKALLEERASKRLGEVVQPPIGRAARTGEDEVFFVPQYVAQRLQLVSKWWMDVVIGEAVRDWSLGPLERGIFPYDREKSLVVASAGDASFLPAIKWLWPYRSALAARSTFQGDMAAAGRQWFEYMQYTKSAHETPLSIAFAFVATHNHFVLDRGGKVFNRSAPIIKLPEDATEDDHLALLAYLNSSTACFWMKQACFPKGGSGMGRGIQDEEWEGRFEFDGTKLGSVPLPALGTDAFTLAAQLDQDGRELAELRGRFTAMEVSAAQWQRESEELRLRQVLLQEELDWCVYADYGLLEPDAAADHDRLKAAAFPGFPRLAPGAQLRPGHRGFEIAMIEDATATSWFARHGHTLDVDDLAVLYGSERVALTRFRMEQARSNSWLSLLETPNFKRRWPSPDYPAESQSVIDAGTMGAIEKRLAESTTVQNAGSLRPADVEQSRAPELLSSESVPFLAAYRYTDAGLTKHALWQETWALQRREDAGEKIGPIDPPPKYDPKDFRKPDYWRLRGKLDVPKERFISYPGCESDEDGEPVYGWAGWDHLQRAKALWQLYSNRKTQEGWPKERLAPLLAGLLELLPWLLQWHDAPNEDGFRMGQEFDALLTAECHDLGLTREDLSAWRPSETAGKRGRKKKSAG
ncbi:MAG: BREX-2 system adenine-specific DNA-methyltransferase PglX, partial [Sandaracinaceae bacterium]|nr:BREX-2 system adenine-specific DNA-methyltransferase PglX [Sandaracinaceae bacterium]